MFLLLLSCLADLAFNFQPGEEEGEGNCEETTAYLVDEDDDGYGTEKQLCEAPGSVVATGQD